MEHKEIVIKVTSSKSSPIIKIVIENERSGFEMLNKKEQGMQDFLRPEEMYEYKVLGKEHTTETNCYMCPKRNSWWDK